MKESNPALPFYFVLAGNDKNLSAFWKETQAKHIPHTKIESEPFLKFTGGVFPAIFWINNGFVEAQSTYISLEQDDIEKWLKKK